MTGKRETRRSLPQFEVFIVDHNGLKCPADIYKQRCDLSSLSFQMLQMRWVCPRSPNAPENVKKPPCFVCHISYVGNASSFNHTVE